MYARDSHDQPHELRNRRIHFHISDVYVPEPAEILRELHGHDLLQGRVVDFSDRGSDRHAFAVVEVAGLSNLVVVPIAKIFRIEE